MTKEQKLNVFIAIIFIVFELLIISIAVVLDTSVFFEYISLWVFYGVSLLLLLPLLLWRFNRIKLLIFTVCSLFLLVILPNIQWNYLKSFYVASHRIQLASTKEEVDIVMQDHAKQSSSTFDDDLNHFFPNKLDWPDTVTLFQPKYPGNEYSADMVEVMFKDNKVVRIDVLPD